MSTKYSAPVTQVSLKGLSPENSAKLQKAVFLRESSGNYEAINQLGYVGGYQMGSLALQEAGLVKMGTSSSNSALNNPANWNNPPGSLDAFLQDPALQDYAYQQYTNRNNVYLTNAGTINSSTDQADLAGWYAASHIGGGPGMNNQKLLGEDANHTQYREYYAIGSSSVSGAPLDITSKTPTPSGKTPSSQRSDQPAYKGSIVGDSANIVLTNEVVGQEPETTATFRNVLEQFSSFDTIFTLSALTIEQVNDPTNSYINGDLGNIVLRSGGGRSNDRISTAYTTEYNKDGKFEFYIDNFQMSTLITYNHGTKGTNATEISFDVFEPYSLGLFLQALKLSTSKDYTNFTEASFLISLEFIGWDSDGQQLPIDSNFRRHIPIKITDAQIEVKNSGCKYAVTAIAWNEYTFVDQNSQFKVDMNISGSSVQEVLQTGKNSLQHWINLNLVQTAEAEKSSVGQNTKTNAVPDEVIIIFPKINEAPTEKTTANNKPTSINPSDLSKQKNSSTTLNVARDKSTQNLVQEKSTLNEIGASSLGFNMNTSGSGSVHFATDVYKDPTKPVLRQANYYDPTTHEFRFPQGTSIVNAIQEILLLSNYCKEVLEKPRDRAGFIRWFRIESQMQVLPPKDGNVGKGKPPKLMIYRVVPYYVHESRFLPPTEKPSGYEELKKLAAKEYNYIYTGQNVDVLSLDINFKAGAYTTLYNDNGAFSKDVSNVGSHSEIKKTNMSKEIDSAENNQDPGIGSKKVGKLNTRYINSGGGPGDDPRTLLAKNFQEALLNSPADMLHVDLEIMGDPYYIADSGMGNYIAAQSSFNINENGSINYQSGEVDIILNYRTPIDYNPNNGIMEFIETQEVPGFSGLYQVLSVKNQINKGRFTQNLDLIRRPNQKTSIDTATTKPLTTAPPAAVPVTSAGKNWQKSLPNPTNGPLISKLPTVDKINNDSVLQVAPLPATDPWSCTINNP